MSVQLQRAVDWEADRYIRDVKAQQDRQTIARGRVRDALRIFERMSAAMEDGNHAAALTLARSAAIWVSAVQTDLEQLNAHNVTGLNPWLSGRQV